MADVAVENNETPIVEKITGEEIDAGKKAVDSPAFEEPTTTENGNSAIEVVKSNEGATENGDSEAVANETDGAVAEVENPAATEAAANKSASATTEENGVEESTGANGDSTDSAHAETVKRKVGESEVKTAGDAVEVTPEKKAKLDDTSKEEVQNGAEASEVAA